MEETGMRASPRCPWISYHLVKKEREKCGANTERHTPPAVLVKCHLSYIWSSHTSVLNCACLHLYAWTWVPEVSYVAHRGSDSPLTCSSPSSSCSTTNQAGTGHFQRSKPLPASITGSYVQTLFAPSTDLDEADTAEAFLSLKQDWSLALWFGVEWSEGLWGRHRAGLAVWRWAHRMVSCTSQVKLMPWKWCVVFVAVYLSEVVMLPQYT